MSSTYPSPLATGNDIASVYAVREKDATCDQCDHSCNFNQHQPEYSLFVEPETISTFLPSSAVNDMNTILWMGIAALGVGILLLVYGLPDVVNNPGFFANFYFAISIFGIIITGVGVVLVGVVITNRRKT